MSGQPYRVAGSGKGAGIVIWANISARWPLVKSSYAIKRACMHYASAICIDRACMRLDSPWAGRAAKATRVEICWAVKSKLIGLELHEICSPHRCNS